MYLLNRTLLQHLFSRQEEVAAQAATVEALQDKRKLEVGAAAAALLRSEAEAREFAEHCAAMEAAAQAEAQALQVQVRNHKP